MPSKTIRKKQLFRRIARPMGITTRQSLERKSRPEIQQLFHPHSGRGPVAGYPLYQLMHEFSKLPKESVGNFVSAPTLIRNLRRLPTVGPFLQRYSALEKSFEQSVWESIRERGIKAGKFWQAAPKEYIDAIIAGGKGRPNLMNDRVGDVAKRVFGDTVLPRTILDIGTFAGGTITGAIKQLSPAQRTQLRIVLVDVNQKAMREHAVPALVALGVPKSQITVLPTSFYSAAVAFKQMRRPLHEKGLRRFEKQFLGLIGKVDLITAGASTLNFANDTAPLFRSIKRLLKPNGVFVDWEWGSAEGKTPTVNVAQLKRRVIATVNGTPVTEFDAYVSFLNFWMSGSGYFNYPQTVTEKLWKDINASERFNFFDWCEQNVDWMERMRKQVGVASPLENPLNRSTGFLAGFRNRAYRDGEMMAQAAKSHGLQVGSLQYPLANPGQKDTGNVNWMIVAQKN